MSELCQTARKTASNTATWRAHEMPWNNADLDVFGDGTVVVMATAGHTPGHQVLFVRLAKTGPVVLAGDLYHYPEEIATGRVLAF